MNISLIYINPPNDYYFTPMALGYMKSMLNTDTSLSDVNTEILEQRHEDSNEMIIEKLKSANPRIIGFSCYIWNIVKVKEICLLIREHLPEAMILWGGPQSIDVETDQYEGKRVVDVIFEGEAELTFLQLVRDVKNASFKPKEFAGISYFEKGKKVTNKERELIKNIDDIPSPYLTGVLPVHSGRFAPLETSRGCPYTCSFCYWHKDFGPVRRFSTDRLKQEIEFLISNGVKKINLLDAVFNLNEKRTVEICEIIAKNNPEGKVRVFADIRPEIFTDKMGYWFDKANIRTLYIGLQTTNRKAMKLSNRYNNLEKIKNCMSIANKYGLKTVVQVINGLPGDTPKDLMRTIQYAKSLNPTDITVFDLLILPGSEFHKNADKYGIKYDEQYKIKSNPTFSETQLRITRNFAKKFHQRNFSGEEDTITIRTT